MIFFKKSEKFNIFKLLKMFIYNSFGFLKLNELNQKIQIIWKIE